MQMKFDERMRVLKHIYEFFGIFFLFTEDCFMFHNVLTLNMES